MNCTMRLSGRAIGMVVIAMWLAGCPITPPVTDVGLVVSPGSLDFGSVTNTLSLQVTKTASSEPMGPLTVVSSVTWLEPRGCVTTADGCVSDGPLDPIVVRVRVDRTQTFLGTNRGFLTLIADNASNKTVEVVLEDPIEVRFAASTQTPQVNQVVAFTDQSAISGGTITSREWDFGDGSTSTAAAPQHAYTAAGAYAVSLTIRTSRGAETLRREGFITVGGTPPNADFSVSPASISQGDTVQFTDRSTSASGSIVSRQWDFGDGEASTETNPVHIYQTAGTFNVTLTVATSSASDTATKPVVVGSRIPPLARFSIEPTKPSVGQAAKFTDLSQPGSAPILTWLWDFGDGGSSTAQHPTYSYPNAGFFDVTLTVTTAHGSDSTTVANVEVRPAAPVAAFRADDVEPATGQQVRFTDLSTSSMGTIVQWHWDFGDGTTSLQRHPTHTYQEAGLYTVSLTVTSNQLVNNTDTETKENYIVARDSGAGDISILRDFVDRPDPNYGWRHIQSYDLTGAFIHVLQMTSQSWRDKTEIASGRIWTHYLTIVEPDIKVSKTALLLVDGGSFNSSEPNENNVDDFIVGFAIASGTVVAVVQNVPAQPVTFFDEVGIREGRTEDAIIAYSYDKFLESYAAGSPDYNWPLLFPMVKAAVRAMDTIHDAAPYLSEKTEEDAAVDDFVVAGASKRGWTTWLTGAVDDRVRAIIPIVIDVLNMDEQMMHHYNSYGYWAPAIYPYAQELVFDRFDTPGGQALLELVDPYEYRGELDMPKLILNSTGDQFFLPDSSQFYLEGLLGENHVNYVANTDHSLDNSVSLLDQTSALSSVLAFYLAVVQDVPRPVSTWTFEDDGTIIVDSSQRPTFAVLWQAINTQTRDFRKDTIGEAWLPVPLAIGADNRVVARPTLVPGAWNAFYVQLSFENAAELAVPVPGVTATPQFVFSTPVRVLPDVYPTFGGERQTAFGGISSDPVFVDYITVQGDAYEMGLQHGQLLRDEIQQFLPRYVAAAISENPVITEALLDSVWEDFTDGTNPPLDARIVAEMDGIADGAEVDAQLVRRANMVPVIESYDGHSAALWDDAVAPGDTLYHTFSQNQNLRRITQAYPLSVVYIPSRTNGIPHTLFTYAGFAMSPVGVNLGGISVGAIGNPDDPYQPGTSHFLPMFRQILYDTTNLRDALSLVYNTPLSTRHTFIIGDGRYETRAAKVEVLSPGLAVTWFENDPSDVFSPRVLPGVVYTGGLGQVFDGIQADYGFFNAFGLQQLTNTYSTPHQNVQNVVIDTAMLNFYLSYAKEDIEAFNRSGYAVFNMQVLLP